MATVLLCGFLCGDITRAEVKAMSTPLRDIRRDINDRLQAIEEERAQLQAQLKSLDEEEATYRRVLDLEETYVPLDAQLRKESPGDFILRSLQGGPRMKEEIRDLVLQAGYFGESPNFGRSLAATFMNLHNAGRIATDPDGRIRARQIPQAA
jgi:septal ring factor EnvC (AmiA/AmiB activator)